MNYLFVLQRRAAQLVAMLIVGVLFSVPSLAQATITHNISSGSLTIPGSSTSNYIITGSTTSNTVTIQSGYQGTITLRNLSITTVSTSVSCMTVQGKYNQSNLNPVTNVKFILEGTNYLKYRPTVSANYCGLQVDQGAQINISAIDPNDNTSGKLYTSAADYENAVYGQTRPPFGGAGIGAPSNSVSQGVGTISCTSGNPSHSKIAGGNVTISSGTVYAHGGHAAGIGGGYGTYYDGIIIITGGVVEAHSQAHAAGIGSGCPNGQGVEKCYGSNSTIIVLPPAEIKATGGPNRSPYHFMYDPEYGLAGTQNKTYIGDPNKPLITIRTEDSRPDAAIYLDLTQNTQLVDIFNKLMGGSDYLAKVRVGKTNSTGILHLNAEFQESTTFFTDASSLQPGTLGRPYEPVVTTVSAAKTIVLPLLKAEISFTNYPSSPLELGYAPSQAAASANRIKVEYNDPSPITNVTYQLQSGTNSDFAGLQFLASDGVTPISAPTSLTNGMVLYISIPIKQDKPVGVYNDVLLIHGRYKGVDLPGYIRQIGQQRVVVDDAQTNSFIKVTAAQQTFVDAYPSVKSETLTLKIDHTGMVGVTYDPLDVVAKYLITTEKSYSDALAANPLYGGNWKNMTVADNNSTNAITSVSFSGKPVGTYYVHWYVESGVASAHSLDVAEPVRTYGGFGPYSLVKPEVTLSLDKVRIDEGGGAISGIATLAAKLDGADRAPSVITIPLSYTGTATRSADYSADVSITIPQGQNSASITIEALSDYLLEGDETVVVAATNPIIGGITYTVKGTPLTLTIADKTDGTITVEHLRDAAEPSINGQLRFKLPGEGATAVTCTEDVKVTYSYSGAPAAGNFTPVSPAEAIILKGNNSVIVDVLLPANNYVVEGQRTVKVTIINVEKLSIP